MSERFTVVKRGYDISEVDEYIAQLETTIRSYKEKDTAINNALISAQITAGNIVKEANENANGIKADAITKLDAITASVSVQKQMVKDFQNDYNNLMHKYLHEVNETEILGLYSKVQNLEEYIDSLVDNGTPKADPPPEGDCQLSSWL